MKKESKRRRQLAPALVPVLLFALVLAAVIWQTARPNFAMPQNLDDHGNTVLNVLGQVDLFLPGEVNLRAFYENYTGIRNCRRIGQIALTEAQSGARAEREWVKLPLPEAMQREILDPESDIYRVYDLYGQLLGAVGEGKGQYLFVDRSTDGPVEGCAYWSNQFTFLLWQEDSLYFITWDA